MALSLSLAGEPLSELPGKPVGDGMFGVLVKVVDVVPQVLIAGTEVPLSDDGAGADLVAGDGVWSGEVPAPGAGEVLVLVGEEEGFRDEVPLNAGERVRILMTERGPNLTFEPADFEEHEPPEAPSETVQPPDYPGPPQPPELVLLVVAVAMILGLAVGVWLGRTFLGARRGAPVQATRRGKPVVGGLYTSADLEALTAEGRTLLLREKTDIDSLLSVAESNPTALIVAFAEHVDGDLAELEREGLPNLVVIGAGDSPLEL